MSELQLLHEAPVAEDQIDHLGHMNVRYYLVRSLAASRELARRVGLSPEACRELGARLEPVDVFTRHHREQLAGAVLQVRGGVLDVEADGLRLYHELVNVEDGVVAAAFVHRLMLRDLASRARRAAVPEMAAEAAARARVEWPEHGRPRTLDLAHATPALRLEEAKARGMAMRAERIVRDDECDEHGVYEASRYQELFWMGEPPSSGTGASMRDFHGIDLRTERGAPLGWAILENRGRLVALPHAGARIQSFGATVELGEKVSVRRHWAFDVGNGELLTETAMVDIAFDIEARRACAIPSAMRARMAERVAADLR